MIVAHNIREVVVAVLVGRRGRRSTGIVNHPHGVGIPVLCAAAAQPAVNLGLAGSEPVG
jgi:hypothetical protein